jgi:hypothetical protein
MTYFPGELFTRASYRVCARNARSRVKPINHSNSTCKNKAVELHIIVINTKVLLFLSYLLLILLLSNPLII